MIELNKITCGDCLELLGQLDNESIDCVITSPPYLGLRNYGLKPLIWGGAEDCEHVWGDDIVGAGKNNDHTAGEKQRTVHGSIDRDNRPSSAFCSLCGAWRGSLGLEPTFQLYIQHLMQIFDEVKRVLKPTGTCWVNMGDSYNNPGANRHSISNYIGTTKLSGQPSTRLSPGVQPKSLCQIPSRFSIAMTDAGWILRNEIIWYKRNCMPSSAKDRFTVDFEKVFFFTKSSKSLYWTHPRKQTYSLVELPYKYTSGNPQPDYIWKHNNTGVIVNYPPVSDRVLREFWTRQNLWVGHDYWFKQQLEDSIWASSDKRSITGASKNKGKSEQGQYALNVSGAYTDGAYRNKRCVWDITTKPFKEAHFAVFPEKLVEPMLSAGCPPEGVVLDPFIGAGTVAKVALHLGRNFIGFDLNPEYIDIANRRIRDEQMQLKLDL